MGDDELDITRAEGEGMPPVEQAAPLPCPFCGAPPQLSSAPDIAFEWFIECGNVGECPITVIGGPFKTRDEAVECWNRRA